MHLMVQNADLGNVKRYRERLTSVRCLIMQTIGQAYEEMQTQNSRLLHQITERDDYNTQVFLEFIYAYYSGCWCSQIEPICLGVSCIFVIWNI